MARRKKTEDDQSTDNTENTDDTFGLPEIEYEPLNRDENQASEETSQASSENQTRSDYEREEVRDYNTTYDDDRPSPWPKILGILAVLLLIGGAYWFFAVYQPQRKAAAEKARREQEARDEAARLAEEQRLAEQRRLAEEQRKADSLANASKVGVIETLNDRTGRYHVVIASAIDGDLIMDYAKKLSTKGVSSKIIPPFGKVKFYRLTIADGDTYADTQTMADGMKGDYGDAIWVIRY